MPIIEDEQQMLKYGQALAQKLSGGDIVCLEGDLGSGKTVLAKGIAKGIGIPEKITSPTFTLLNIYETNAEAKKRGIKQLAHIDTYRLKHETELTEIGVEDYLGAPETISVIEWPEKIAGLLRKKNVTIVKIEHLAGAKRHVTTTIKTHWL